MRKKVIFLVCFIVASVTLSAQEMDPEFTLFPWASMFYNPGAVGEQNNTLCFTGLFSNKYMGFRDSQNPGSSDAQNLKENPFGGSRSFLVNIEFFSRKIRGAVGLSFLKDDIGASQNNITVRLGYTYRMKIGNGNLGLGFQATLANQNLDPTNWRPRDPGDQVIEDYKAAPSFMDLDFNLGVHYKTENWDAGISMVNLLGNSSITLSGGDGLLLARQLYIHGGYVFSLPWAPSWTIEPKALIKTELASFQLDAILLARYNSILWGGLSYRINDAVSVLFGARPFFNSSSNYLRGLDIGVSYSFTTTKFGYKDNGSKGDIEVVLRYCFDIYRTETFFGYGSSRSIYKNRY